MTPADVWTGAAPLLVAFVGWIARTVHRVGARLVAAADETPKLRQDVDQAFTRIRQLEARLSGRPAPPVDASRELLT